MRTKQVGGGAVEALCVHEDDNLQDALANEGERLSWAEEPRGRTDLLSPK